MPRERRRKINYLTYNKDKIPGHLINMKDFEFIDDLKLVEPEDYTRIFTIVDQGMYSYYIPKQKYYCLLKKEIFNKQLKEITNESSG